jgi:hypothetical protein
MGFDGIRRARKCRIHGRAHATTPRNLEVTASILRFLAAIGGGDGAGP